MKITWKRSPNFFADTGKKEVIVIHKTLGLMPGTLQWLTVARSQVSSHFLITKKGEIYQLVKEKDGAWHVGVERSPSARWLKFDRLGVNNNRYTIGIEFEALVGDRLSNMQYRAGAWLINKLNLPVVTHRDIASYKPNMETDLAEIKRQLQLITDEPTPEPKPEPEIGSIKSIILDIINGLLKLLTVLTRSGIIK